MPAFNLSATVNIVRLLFDPQLCRPTVVIPTFNQLPTSIIPNRDIRAVVLDKDNCFAQNHDDKVWPEYTARWEQLKSAYPGAKLLIVSNSAGTNDDGGHEQAKIIQERTGVTVLRHSTKKPGCHNEIMQYFKDANVCNDPSQVAIVGDRLFTDVIMANMMGAHSVWLSVGVVHKESRASLLMTTRTVNHFKTLREILDYNDRLTHNLYTDEETLATHAPHYRIKEATLFSVINWNEIMTNRKLIVILITMILATLGQLAFSYVAIGLVNVQQDISLFYVSQGLNLLFSYVLPMTMLTEIDVVRENPLEKLSTEIQIYRRLRVTAVIQFLCTVISGITLNVMITGGPYTREQFGIGDGPTVTEDVTGFVRLIQFISFQISLVVLILTFVNLYMTDRKIRCCFNRVERMQNTSDMEVMFNDTILQRRYNPEYF
ncbi:hypothetical protein JL09_g1420 [Pichia kudriavzevii]|uniref:Phosphatidylglycerophosphatase GEP4, mitochondrial n=1 Tax=Pichia kudriavzevii TaxID=4909 RepID=A0A099P588_PICKU|nr:hypothetical protein JL09_g1420 [Pichia kudriavzevii]